MKRLLLIIIIGCYSAIATTPHEFWGMTILQSEPINPYLRLYEAVRVVESGADTSAYNAKEGATGELQIRQIRMDDYRMRTGKDYHLQNAFNPKISKEIFLYYASQYRPDEYETISKRWNGSGELTKKYWQKVKSELQKQSKTSLKNDSRQK